MIGLYGEPDYSYLGRAQEKAHELEVLLEKMAKAGDTNTKEVEEELAEQYAILANG